MPFIETMPWESEEFPRIEVPPARYTSLMGLYIRGPIPDRLDWEYTGLPRYPYDFGARVEYWSNMTFPVKQFEFRCPSMAQDQANGTWISYLGPNSTYNSYRARTKGDKSGFGFFVDTNATSDSLLDDPQGFLFRSFIDAKVTLWQCYLYVATRNATTICNVERHKSFSKPLACSIRNVSVPQYSITTAFRDFNLSTKLLTQWPLIDPGFPGTSSLTEKFIALGPDALDTSAIDVNETNPYFFEPFAVDLSTLDNVTFARRLTTVFNTYVQATQLRIERDTRSISTLMISEGGLTKSSSATPLLVLPFKLVACNWLFFTILTVVSLFLIGCCGLNIWLLRQISTPDILGFVSSSTIENPCVLILYTIPGAGSSMDGLERARMLKKVQVQIRNVQPKQEVGKFAITNNIQKRVKIDIDRNFV